MKELESDGTQIYHEEWEEILSPKLCVVIFMMYIWKGASVTQCNFDRAYQNKKDIRRAFYFFYF